MTWDLSKLYAGFDAPEFLNDVAAVLGDRHLKLKMEPPVPISTFPAAERHTPASSATSCNVTCFSLSAIEYLMMLRVIIIENITVMKQKSRAESNIFIFFDRITQSFFFALVAKVFFGYSPAQPVVFLR